MENNKIKRFHSPAFKAKVAMEMIKEIDAASAICSKYGIHPTQAKKWKQRALQGLEAIFAGKPADNVKAKDQIIEELYKQIGQLKVESDWLKKKVETVSG